MGTMTGVTLTAAIVTGFKAGIGDAVQTIATSLNNQYLTEILIMLIGLGVIVNVVLFLLFHHKDTSIGLVGTGNVENGVNDARISTHLEKQGWGIDAAVNYPMKIRGTPEYKMAVDYLDSHK